MIDARPSTVRPSDARGASDRSTLPVSRGVYLRAWAALLAERTLAGLWPLLSLLAGLFAVLVSGLLPALAGWLHLALLVAGAAALGFVGWRYTRLPRLPRRVEVMHRLEQANGLPDRPLVALEDALAAGAQDATSRALWELHLKRAREALHGLAAPAPEPHLTRRDPNALRLAALLLLVVALGAAGDRTGDNVAASLSPAFGERGAPAALTIDAWITPPEYTGAAPVFLTRVEETPEGGQRRGPVQAAVPQGSTLVAQVGGAAEAPTLTAGEEAIGFEPQGSDSFRITRTLEESADLRVDSDRATIADWQVTVIPDRPPTAALSVREDRVTARGSVELLYEAEDDYGVAEAAIYIARTNLDDGRPPIVIELAPTARGERELSGGVFVNRPEHVWAGAEVTARLEAVDARGQSTLSEPVDFVLPAREFEHPVARQIIEQRRRLAEEGVSSVREVAQVLRAIAWRSDAYDGDVVVFMGLTLSARRLAAVPETPADAGAAGENGAGAPAEAAEDRADEAPAHAAAGTGGETIEKSIDLLWDLALRLEDGGLSIAERRLRDAEQALMDAIARNAPQEEIDRLMDELQRAMDEYLEALARNALEQMRRGEFDANPMDENVQTLAKRDIDRMMERIRELLREGNTEAAQRMLSQLKQMMENLQAGVTSQPSPQGMQAMDMLDSLQELMRGQSELLDRTFDNARGADNQQGRRDGRQGDQRQSGEQRRGQSSADAALQEALRRQLGDLMRRFGEMMGEVPSPFGRAEGEMRQSTDALRRDRPGEAIDPQGRALDQLQEAARAAQQAFMERFGAEMGQGEAQGQGPNMGERDPFGRNPNMRNQGHADGDVTIPEESDLQRAREIRDELRRRAGERHRSNEERDYIDRLLRQFE